MYYLKQSLEEAVPVFTRIGNKHVVNGYLDIYAPLKANQGMPKWVFVWVREVFARGRGALIINIAQGQMKIADSKH